VGFLWRALAPKPLKSARRTVYKTMNPVTAARQAVTPRVVHRALNPIDAVQASVETAAVRAVRGKKPRRSTASPGSVAKRSEPAARPGAATKPRIPELVVTQGFVPELGGAIRAAKKRLVASTSLVDQLTNALLIRNLRQMELSAFEMLLDYTSEEDPRFDGFIDWAAEWSHEANADVQELGSLQQNAMRVLSQDDVNTALEAAQSAFSATQDRISDLPDFEEVRQRFQEHQENVA
jgi:hypothetical protein